MAEATKTKKKTTKGETFSVVLVKSKETAGTVVFADNVNDPAPVRTLYVSKSHALSKKEKIKLTLTAVEDE